MTTSGDQNPQPYGIVSAQFTLICLRIDAVLCSLLAGSMNSVTKHCQICYSWNCLLFEKPSVCSWLLPVYYRHHTYRRLEFYWLKYFLFNFILLPLISWSYQFSCTEIFTNLYILGVFEKLRKATISFVMSVCLSISMSVRMEVGSN